MATISASTNEAVYRIEKFLGLNENPDGDNKLKLGEATKCENWKVTRDLNLKRRPGTHTLFTLGNSPVKGLWSGNVSGTKMTLAACNGHLWKIRENDEYLDEPQDLGEFDTSNRVNFFAYSNIVYILNGEEYMQYDGVSFKQVTGYIPVVAVARTPSGSQSTLLEEVNKLNNMRRVWFSPDGEDNVFVLPEKDILSVHYVKNLSNQEYIDPATYNVDRMSGTVTFGTDTEIEYDGENDSYVISDESITDVGSIEINGEVPAITYTTDRDGVTFKETPKYGQAVTLTTGTEFEEEFTADGETATFTLENTELQELEVSVDGESKWQEPYYSNSFNAGQISSQINLLHTLKLNDSIEITSKEDVGWSKDVTFASAAESAVITKPVWMTATADHVDVKYTTTGTELPECEDPEVLISPYPESTSIDKEMFLSGVNNNLPTGGLEHSVGDMRHYFRYDADSKKWLYSVNPYFGGTYPSATASVVSDTRISISCQNYSEDSLGKVYTIMVSGTSTPPSPSATLMLTLGKDYEYEVHVFQSSTIIDVSLYRNLSDMFIEKIGVAPQTVTATPRFGKITGGPTSSTGIVYSGIDLFEDFGITYEPSMPPTAGDLIEVKLLRNFAWDESGADKTIYIMPNGSAVTSQTKFTVTLHIVDERTTTALYNPDYNRINLNPGYIYPMEYFEYYNVFNSDINTGATEFTQKELIVKINGRRYYEDGDYSFLNNTITLVETPDSGAVIHVDEIHEAVEKTIYADGETNTFKVGLTGAKSISASLDGDSVTVDKRFSFDPDTMTITILDSSDLSAGDIITVKGKTAPSRGTNVLEICYSAGMAFTQTVNRMTNAEIFLGVQDNAVFLYGDGTNKAFYSGIDYNGQPRADYFPDLNEMAVADTNTPITGMIRHYSQLICFKSKSAYTVQYGIITQADGIQQYGFYITPINKEIGCTALGQVRLVLNSPYVLYGDDLYKWTSNSRYSASLSADERNAFRVSDRIYATLAQFNTAECYCYDDNFGQEYYIWCDNKALVYNYASDAWYVYSGLYVTSMCNIDEIVLVGTADGKVLVMSEEYTSDDGTAFDSYWESGSLDFGKNYIRKFMSELWVGLKPDAKYSVTVSGKTEKKELLATKEVSGEAGTNLTPFIKKLKIKAKKFAFLKLMLESNKDDSTATVVSLATKIRETGFIK